MLWATSPSEPWAPSIRGPTSAIHGALSDPAKPWPSFRITLVGLSQRQPQSVGRPPEEAMEVIILCVMVLSSPPQARSPFVGVLPSPSSSVVSGDIRGTLSELRRSTFPARYSAFFPSARHPQSIGVLD